MDFKKRHGFMGQVWVYVSIFVVGLIALALIVPFAQQVGVASADGNVSAAAGAKQILQILTTLFAITIASLFIGSRS